MIRYLAPLAALTLVAAPAVAAGHPKAEKAVKTTKTKHMGTKPAKKG